VVVQGPRSRADRAGKLQEEEAGLQCSKHSDYLRPEQMPLPFREEVLGTEGESDFKGIRKNYQHLVILQHFIYFSK
jgi:hypothetical protein